MEFRQRFSAALLLGMSAAGLVWADLPGGGPAEGWTLAQIAQETGAVSGTIATFGSTFGANMQIKFEQLLSALAVTTKQEAVSAQVVSDGARQAGDALAGAVNATQTAERVAQAQLNYSGRTGQGHDVCGTMYKNKTLDRAFNSMPDRAQRMMASLDVAPGRLVPSVSASMQSRLADHRRMFCTQGEADAGLCRKSDLPGGDANAALLFESVPADSLQAEARKAYIEHVLGSPDQRLDAAAGRTPAGQAYMLSKTRKDALLSIPAWSLAMISTANTKLDELDGRSPNELLKLRVGQYFGGAEAQSWSGSLAGQMPRGLIVEAAKMAGLESWMRYKRYEQNQRLESNLAALLIAQSGAMTASLSEQRRRAAADLAASEVR